MKGIEFAEEGWKSIEARQLPPRESIVEFAREEQVYWQSPWFGKWEDLQPEFNVAGLWWRELK